ncbi:UDP-Glycosyltransferase/glycogen phosphorylase [Aspergillus heteromorphus CBS 117.55]|uniref:UDP-Glycosyltransferase/glycogen phosphorylase n=1 Tax=Aspergillus heteromorphus CBS 117.55 TaxID=1448321 RepID=A0A317WX44_9EURO|nr:UDP-Glycosyltransferase/glycogen phosphorylase [Aspergillus heteromorphus CBS 117.55]PWY89902.1 UDP-Glycosyltransferase/glycogen phosphorylase [Aspergillus heteromorphus CBS 117.55]
MDTSSPQSDDFPSILKGKRILLTTESLGPVNGVSRTTSNLIEYLRRNGVDLVVVAPQFQHQPAPSPSPSDNDIRLPGYPLPYNPDLTLVYPFHLQSIYSPTLPPDLIYIASPASLGFQTLLQTRQLHSPPPILLNYQTDLTSYSSVIFPAPLAHFATWLLSTVEGYLFLHPSIHIIFYPCTAVLTYLKTTTTNPTTTLLPKAHRLARGVNTTLFHPSHRSPSLRALLSPKNEGFILLTVCRLAPEKGFEFLASIAQRLLASKIPFKLVIVGGNRNPDVETSIRRLFDPVKDHVIFLGFLTGEDLARAYASADLFLHCSITETFGLVVLEAMASGVPVIARDAGGPSDIVRNQETGYLVPPDEEGVFAALVAEVCRDERLRGRLAVRARAYAEEMTWENIHRRVAGRMADALVEREGDLSSETALLEGNGRGSGSGWSVLEKVRLGVAVGVVHLMWLVAVVPLIVHGERIVSRILRRIPLVGKLVSRGRS